MISEAPVYPGTQIPCMVGDIVRRGKSPIVGIEAGTLGTIVFVNKRKNSRYAIAININQGLIDQENPWTSWLDSSYWEFVKRG